METMKTFTLGNTIYEITDEKARKNIEELQKDIEEIYTSFQENYRGYMACARGIEDSTYLTGNGAFDKIELTTWVARNNSIILLSSDGGIKCPVSGIVKIWGSVELNGVHNTEKAGVYIFKNDDELIGCYGYGQILSNVQAVTEVSAGDIIYLKARTSGEENTVIEYPKSIHTNLCVEYC